MKIVGLGEGRWLISWDLQEEMYKALSYNGKPFYLNGVALPMSVQKRELSFAETKRVVVKELEAQEGREQMQIGRDNRTQVRAVSPEISKERTRVHRTLMSGFPPSIRIRTSKTSCNKSSDNL